MSLLAAVLGRVQQVWTTLQLVEATVDDTNTKVDSLASGAFINAIYTGDIAITGSMSNGTVLTNTSTITAVDTAKTIVFFNGFNSDGTAAASGQYSARVVLTNATTVTAYVGYAGGTSSASNHTVSYTVIEYS